MSGDGGRHRVIRINRLEWIIFHFRHLGLHGCRLDRSAGNEFRPIPSQSPKPESKGAAIVNRDRVGAFNGSVHPRLLGVGGHLEVVV
jgi:hypothetical protein